MQRAPATPRPITPLHAALLGRRAPAPNRRRPDPRWTRTMREMTSLLISAVAGALVTGAASTLIMMSAPAYALPDGLATAELSPTPVRLPPEDYETAHPWRDLPERAQVHGPRALELPPVCTCTLPPPLTLD